MPLSLHLLGPLDVLVEGRSLALGGPQQRRLLAALALQPGRWVSLEDVVEAVWPGDPPPSAAAAVQAYVSRLRSLLGPAVGVPGPAVLVGGPDGYLLDVPPDAVDVHRFDVLLQSGARSLREGDIDRAAQQLEEAAGLWRGPLLGDLELAGGLMTERQRLSAARTAALDLRYDAELARGRAAEVLPDLLQRVAALPLHEPAYLHLMTALEATGRQADALQVYTDARRAFRDELGADPGVRLRRAHEQLLTRASPSTRRGCSGLRTPVNPLIGREADVAAVRELLREARLVTVAGAAGAGKTRLAVEVAREVDELLVDGACLVELSTATSGADVARAVALAVGVLEQPHRDLAESVAEALAGREQLLVLDNCEHVAGAAADVVVTVLAGAVGVRVLATSQEALRVEGEHLYRLGPLDVPEGDAPAAEVEAAPAGQLFVQRARAVHRGFRVTEHNAAAVARLCRELDGLPLALELAAATLAVVDLDHVAERLPDRFALLARGTRTAPPRHRSLQAAVEWSYDLLTPAEREVYHQLSVFSGGFDLESAEQVCAVPPGERLLPLIASLVDKSFLQSDVARGRFTLLETLRLHGLQRLAEQGDEAAVRDRHARAVLGLCAAAAPELRGRAQGEWIARLGAERDNVAAALRWAMERGDVEVALGVVATLWWYWWRNGHIPEGAQWAEQVLALPLPDRPGLPGLRAAALVGASHLWWKLGAFDRAEPACAEALALLAAEQAASPLSPAARGVLAMVARDRGDLPAARALLHEVLADYVALKEPWGEAATLNMLVSVDRDSQDLDVAVSRLERSTALFDRLGDPWGQAWSAWLTGRVATRLGELDRAATSLRHSIVVAAELGHSFGVVLGVAGVAGVAAEGGNAVVAARLLGATEALEQAMGVPVRAIEREDSARDVAVTLAALGPVDYETHWDAGFALAPDVAVQEALSCAVRPAAEGSSRRAAARPAAAAPRAGRS